jgi:hypothetical protein
MFRRLFAKLEAKNTRRAPVCVPIIVDEQGSAIVFESVADAEQYLEAIDVQNNEYLAYDSEGRLLRLLPTTPQITVESAELRPSHSKEVRDLLVRLLTYTGVPEAQLQAESLKQLVTRSLEYKTK